MGYVLLTNDDGVDSPSLLPFIHALNKHHTVRAVVPAQERSWIGKAITRFETVAVTCVQREGVEIHIVDGFPADCVQLGVYSLFDEMPEMVVSGINLGLNHGLAFLLSSGTVGAAAEGAIAGLPAVAFSTGDLDKHEIWGPRAWKAHPEKLWNRAANVAVDVLHSIRDTGFPPGTDLISVNFPHNADLSTPRVVTRLAVSSYNSVFRATAPGRFVHDFTEGLQLPESVTGSDYEALDRGQVSITPIQLARESDPDKKFRLALEQP